MDAFIAEARRRALTTTIVAWREEYGPAETAEGNADYRLVREVTLLGYDKSDGQGTILRCELADTARDTATARLAEAGFTVEERCRNLAAPG